MPRRSEEKLRPVEMAPALALQTGTPIVEPRLVISEASTGLEPAAD
jgi:hypothetical protein